MGSNLKKSGLQRNTNENASHFVDGTRLYKRVADDKYFDSPDIVKTVVTTTATRIKTPVNSREFVLFHQEADESFFMGDKDVSVSDVEVFDGDMVEFTQMQKDDGNEIYGITSTGTVTVFAMGVIKA